MKSYAVIGCGFGDEGKGKVVSYLCSREPNALVVRYCGGQQAAHHVVLDDNNKHVFSNFGSGSLQGNDTLWSQFCTVDPVGILNEMDVLVHKGCAPMLYIHPDCPVTTPYEKQYNRNIESVNNHGSCGVGVGQTFQREEDYHSILFSDLYYPSVLKMKLKLLERYYGYQLFNDREPMKSFLQSCEDIIESIFVSLSIEMDSEKYESIIFEGSQGLLLDQRFGFFPHVTRANTGTKNILAGPFRPELFLVTRAYQTRHGNGPMTNEGSNDHILPNPYEQNSDDTFQGEFRTSTLDIDLLRYALNKDQYIRETKRKKTLAITCLDLLREYKLTVDGCELTFDDEGKFVLAVKHLLGIKNCIISRSPYPAIEGA